MTQEDAAGASLPTAAAALEKPKLALKFGVGLRAVEKKAEPSPLPAEESASLQQDSCSDALRTHPAAGAAVDGSDVTGLAATAGAHEILTAAMQLDANDDHPNSVECENDAAAVPKAPPATQGEVVATSDGEEGDDEKKETINQQDRKAGESEEADEAALAGHIHSESAMDAKVSAESAGGQVYAESAASDEDGDEATRQDHGQTDLLDHQEPAAPQKSKEEILMQIQGVDESITQTELEIESLQEKFMAGQAEIFTNLKEAKLPEGAIAIYNSNRSEVMHVKAELAAVMSHSAEQDMDAQPLYTRVEEAPGYMRVLETHAMVRPVVEAVIRHEVRQRKRKQIGLAFEYRQLHREWIREKELPKLKKPKKGELSLPGFAASEEGDAPQRKTRSRDAVRSEAEFQELLGAMEEEVKRKSAVAVLPRMLVTAEERAAYCFQSSNGFVIDPQLENWEKYKYVNAWTDEEKSIFMEKLADFASRPEKDGLRKNFYKISHYLPNKTTSDCIQYYYLNKKSVAFQEKYRKLELKHRRTYHLKSKGEKLLQAPSLAYQQSTYEATRGPQWTQQILARRARNDRAEGVLLGGFEGLDSYDELPADVVLPVEKEKGPTKRAAAAAARAAAERRREEEDERRREEAAMAKGASEKEGEKEEGDKADEEEGERGREGEGDKAGEEEGGGEGEGEKGEDGEGGRKAEGVKAEEEGEDKFEGRDDRDEGVKDEVHRRLEEGGEYKSVESAEQEEEPGTQQEGVAAQMGVDTSDESKDEAQGDMRVDPQEDETERTCQDEQSAGADKAADEAVPMVEDGVEGGVGSSEVRGGTERHERTPSADDETEINESGVEGLGEAVRQETDEREAIESKGQVSGEEDAAIVESEDTVGEQSHAAGAEGYESQVEADRQALE